MKYLVGALGAVTVLALAAVAFIYSGIFNVSAKEPEASITTWALRTTMEQGVQRRASQASVPTQFSAVQVRAGARAFGHECAICHGAPGVPREAWAKSMNPMPPDLAKAAPRWSPAELHWIIRNGVKMSGMPAMSDHHSDEELWSIVAFVKALPQMTPATFQAVAPNQSDAAGHDH